MSRYSSPATSGLAGHLQNFRRMMKGDFVPVSVALGLIALSVSFGLYSMGHQLVDSPNVFVSKKRRETLPEVEDPDYIADEADKFIRRSFFRRIAHIQDFSKVRVETTDPTRPDPFKTPQKVETLKTVGVESNLHTH